jgi:hypothetical protein
MKDLVMQATEALEEIKSVDKKELSAVKVDR